MPVDPSSPSLPARAALGGVTVLLALTLVLQSAAGLGESSVASGGARQGLTARQVMPALARMLQATLRRQDERPARSSPSKAWHASTRAPACERPVPCATPAPPMALLIDLPPPASA
jgi:hypothetical protein